MQRNENLQSAFALGLKAYILLQGVDPDAPEEDEENEVEDADVDQEEPDLL